MKVLKRVGARRILLMAPFALLVILVIAVSGPIASGGAYGINDPMPPPVPGFTPAPVPPAYNAVVGIDIAHSGEPSVVNMLADPTLYGNAIAPNVHVIDVRSSFEYLADVCPMQIALGLPLYTVTNVGHPMWANPVTGAPERAYSDPYWIGFNWDGVPYYSLWNIRMQENPNFGSYLNALVADGGIKKNDKLIFLCQTGYRASWAAAEATSMGFSHVDVLYGGMLAWNDDWITSPTAIQPYQKANLATDPSPGDCPAEAAPAVNCDPDNTAGPAATTNNVNLNDGLRHKETDQAPAPWKYDTGRLALVGAPVIWNGTEPHVGVKAEWLPGDFQLAPSTAGVSWASYADYTNRLLSVNLKLTNNPPAPPGPLNYPASCGGTSPPCEHVFQAAHGTAYNSKIVAAPSTNGVIPTGLPASIGNIAPNTAGMTAVKFNVPVNVSFFKTNMYAIANDVPDPNAPMGPGYAWYFTYTYPGPTA